MKICKTCGAENDDIAIYCGSCGTLLENGAYTYKNDEAENKSPYSESGERSASGSETYATAQPDNFATQQNNYYSQNQGSYYQQPSAPVYNPNQMPREEVKKGGAVGALVVAVIIGDLIGLVFSILALVSASGYEKSESPTEAQIKLGKSKTYTKVAWIFNVIGIIFTIIISLFTGIVFNKSYSGYYDDYDNDEFYEMFGDDFESPFDDDDFDFDIDGDIDI